MSPQSCLLRLHYPSVLHNLASTFQPSCAVCGGLYPIASARYLFPTIADAGLPDRNGIPVRSIWYSERGFEVSAEACNNRLRILFRFSTHPCFRQSVKGRIAACDYDLPFEDMAETFPDLEPAREASSSSMTTVRDAGSNHPSIKMPECIAPAKTAHLARWWH